MAAKKAGMSTGVEVARISVKVSPDTSGFREELKRKLKALKQGLDDQGVVDLDADVDTKTVEKKVDKSTKKMAADASRNLSKIKIKKIDASGIEDSIAGLNKLSGKFDINTTKFDLSKLPKDIGKSTASLNKQGGVIGMPWDEAKAKEDAKKHAALVESMKKKTDEFGVLNLSWDKKMRDFKLGPSLRKEFVEGRSETNRVIQEFDIVADRARAASEEIDRLFDASDKKTLRSALRDYALGFRDISYAAQKAREESERIGGIFGQTFGIQSGRDQLRARGGLTGALLGGVAGITALKGASMLLKGMGETVAKLPGMFGEAGTALGNITSKIGGIGGKLKPNFGSGINLAGYALILGAITLVAAPLIGLISAALLTLPGLIGLVLAPVAGVMLALDGIKEAAKVLEEPFNKMRENLSAIAKEQFAPMFESIGKIFPTLERAMPAVTQGLADMGKSIADFFAEGEGQVMLEETITGIGAALTNVSPGVRDFVAALTDLAHEFVTGGALEGVGDWFNETMANFREWVASEDITGMFDGLGASLKVVLDTVGELAMSGLDFVKDPAKMDGFLATLDSMGDFLEGILNLSNALADVWDVIAWPFDKVGETLDMGSDILRDLPGIGGVWDSVLPEGWSTKAEEEARTGGARVGKVFTTSREEAMRTGMGAGLPNASRERRGLDPVAMDPNTVKTPETQIVIPPDTAKANEVIKTYLDNAKTSVEGVKTALSSIGELPAPNLSGFKDAFTSLPQVTTDAMQAVTDSVTAGGQNAANAALGVSQNIYNAMVANAALFQTVGLQMMAGLAAGIQAGAASAISAAVSAATSALNAAKGALGIKSPSRKFMEVGDYSMQGMAKGMENGIQPVIDQAKDLAAKVAQAFADGSDPTLALKGFSGKEINRMEKVLGSEVKGLNAQIRANDALAKTTGNPAYKAEADRLRLLKESADAHKDMLDLANEYNDTTSSGGGEDPFVKGASQLMNSPVDFAKATGKQFLSDIGIGGDGLIGKAITEGISYVFNIGSVDEALSIKDREDSKASMSAMGR